MCVSADSPSQRIYHTGSDQFLAGLWDFKAEVSKDGRLCCCLTLLKGVELLFYTYSLAILEVNNVRENFSKVRALLNILPKTTCIANT